MRFIPAAILAVSLALPIQSAPLTGRVVDATGMAIPGAAVEISGRGVSGARVSDRMGRFRVDDLAVGSYQLTVRLAGFRTQSLSVQLDPAAASEVVVTLRTEILSEVLWVVPPPGDAYRQAAAIAHVRIDRTRPAGACGDAAVVTSHHDASVLRVFKGRMPAAIELDQEAAGQCREMLKWYEGTERPYRAGDEYVVFLSEQPGGFGLLAGPSLVFPVHGDLVSLNGFAGVRGSVRLDALGELLERLARNAPPDRRRALWPTPGTRAHS